MSRFTLLTRGLLVLVALGALLVSCRQKEADTPAAGDVAARYATPELLIEQYNALTTAEPVRARELVALYLPANETQKQILRIQRHRAALYELSVAIRDQFGEDLRTVVPDSGVKRLVTPARLDDQSAQDARAVYTGSDGAERSLFLVRRYERWWIDGRTLEENIAWARDAGRRDAYETVFRIYDDIVAPLTPRVHQGRYETVEAFESAFRGAMEQHALAHPHDIAKLRELMETRPDIFRQRPQAQ